MDRLSELEKRVEALEALYRNEHPVFIQEPEERQHIPEKNEFTEPEPGFTEDAQ